MKTETTNSRRLDVVGSARKSDLEIFNSVLKRWQQRFGYWSIFAAVPAMVISQVQTARTGEAKQEEASVAGRTPRLIERLKTSYSNRALLKRQSQFRLPHQQGELSNVAPLAGLDDCPGPAIPAGIYTAAAPFLDSGDTTGANNTVSTFYMYSFGYQTHSAIGPVHVYSFTLTGRGQNPQIQVSRTSGTYEPVIYVLQDEFAGRPCPAGTGNHVYNGKLPGETVSSGTATINSQRMNFLPLNVPLYLFVDSDRNDAFGFGPYTITIQDVTIAPQSLNQIDDAQFFVRQHYRDFLNREPDDAGLAFWTNEITSCGGEPLCVEVKRINVSAAFFLSIEFQQSGYLVYRMYKTAYGDMPGAPVPLTRQEFLSDTQHIGQGFVVGASGWEQALENNKNSYATNFVARTRFTTAFPSGMTAEQFVDALNANAGEVLSQGEHDLLVGQLVSGTKTRAQILRAVAEDPDLTSNEFNKAFVLMQYFGYLRRNPSDLPDTNFAGYNFWLNKLNQFNGDFIAAEMVEAFTSSGEFRQRFGP